MHVLVGHKADRVLPVGAEFDHDTSQGYPPAFGGPERIVELNAFKKSLDEELLSVSVGRSDRAVDSVTSNREAIQQARFREARRLKRVEALELEVRLARAQNEALRVALETAVEVARQAEIEAATGVVAAPQSEHAELVTRHPTEKAAAPQSEPTELVTEHPHALRLGRFLARLRQGRR